MRRTLTGINLKDSKDVLFLKKHSEKYQIAILQTNVLDIYRKLKIDGPVKRFKHFKNCMVSNIYQAEVFRIMESVSGWGQSKEVFKWCQ
jgi:hypothetical protein